MLNVCLFQLFLLVSSHAFAAIPEHVILITLDGVMLETIEKEYINPNLIPFTISQVKQYGLSTQNDPLNRTLVSNSSAKSLPGYRAILSGQFESSCENNECGQIENTTILDEVPDSVVFASWDRVGRASTNRLSQPIEGSIALRTPNLNLISEETKNKIFELYQASKNSLPIWKDARKDLYTWEMAKTYLAERVPQLTFISFLDTDEWAHHRKKGQVLNALKEFDQRYNELNKLLLEKGVLDNTSFIITTDHGRGKGVFWTTHGKTYRHSKKVFSFVIPSKFIRENITLSNSSQEFEQKNVKSLIQKLLLIKPNGGDSL